MAIDLAKLSEGLNRRLDMLKFARSPDRESLLADAEESLALSFLYARLNLLPEAEQLNYRDTSIAHYILVEPTLDARAVAALAFKDFFQASHLPAMLLGGVTKLSIDAATEIHSPIDYSHYCQSLFASGAKIADAKKIESIFKNFFDEVYAYIGVQNERLTFADISTIAEQFGHSHQINNLASLRTTLEAIKERAWYIVGIDVFLPFEMLLDRNFDKYLDKVTLAKRHLQSARLLNVVSKLDVLIQNSHMLTATTTQLIAQPFEELDEDQIERRIFATSTPKNWRSLDEAYFPVSLSLINALKRFVADSASAKIWRYVTYIFEVDTRLLMYLDWDAINDALPAYVPGYNLFRSFTDLCFTQRWATHRFPDLMWTRGLGTFMGSFSVYVAELRRKSDTQRSLLTDVKKELPLNAARFLCRSILDKSNFERLARMLPSQRTSIRTSHGQTDDDRIVMEQRVSLAFTAQQLDLISMDDFSEIVDREKELLVLRKFHSQLKHGRIRVQWATVERQILVFSKYIGSHLATPTVRDANTEHREGFLNALMVFSAADVVQDLLFDGPGAFDRLLGNNLRHGVIITLFTSAFNKALPAGNVKADWTNQSTEKTLGKAFLELNKFREFTLNTLNEYMAHWLTIDQGGALQKRTSQAIIRSLRDYIKTSGGQFEAHIAAPLVTNSVKQCFSDFINKSRSEFSNRVGSSIRSNFESVRNRLQKEEIAPTVFLDNLDEQLNSAISDVTDWIKVVTFDSDFDDFSVADIVKLESEMLYLAKPRDAGILPRCEMRTDDNIKGISEIIVRGKYFDLMNEIVHNLISNAFKFSGLKTNTRIDLRFLLSGDDFIIESRNSMTIFGRTQAMKEFSKASALASGSKQSKERDNNSGFAKIRAVGEQLLQVEPRITIEKPTARSQEYVVNIVLANQRRKLVSEASDVD